METNETAGATILDLEVLEGPLRGERVAGLSYRRLGAGPTTGDTVLANTLGLEMGLGTGGVAVVVPGGGGDAPPNENHFAKLPYTPLQFAAEPPEQGPDLVNSRVVVLPLHSHLAPACCAAGDLMPGCRVSFVWQEGGALPVGFSRSAPELRDRGLLDVVVSSGNCFGGDIEAPNVYAGLLAAARVSDVVLIGIGPGIVGSGSFYGHGGMAAAGSLNAACALGARPVLAPRLSEADPRDRHRGISHHTRSALQAALGEARVALPPSAGDLPVEGLPNRHRVVPVSYGAAGLEARFGVTFESMGRTYAEDRPFFDAAAAAVALALGGAG
ncbi:MAG: DUF3866 family protein [Rubrobacteraceae bacterium]